MARMARSEAAVFQIAMSGESASFADNNSTSA
jgi:hypothetical protein